MKAVYKVRNYENNEGKRVYVTEIVADNVRFLESNRNNTSSNNGSQERRNNSSHNNPDPFCDDGKPIDISDDDLPF